MPDEQQTEPRLHVFSLAGEEWYVAMDREDAKRVIELMTGCTVGDFADANHEFDEADLEQVPDTEVFQARGTLDGKIASDDDPHDPNHPILLIFTAEVWCRREGRGLLFAQNY